MIFQEHIFLFSTSPLETQDDSTVLPNSSPDPLHLPTPIPAQAPLPQLVFPDSPSNLPHPSLLPIDPAPPTPITSLSSTPSPVIPHLPSESPTPSMATHPPPIRQSSRPTKPPTLFKDYQAHHAALLAPVDPSSGTSGTRYPIT